MSDHLYMGACPDELQPEAFDEDCPACIRQRQQEADSALLDRVRASATIVAARYGQNEDVMRLEFDSSDVMRQLAERLKQA